MKNEVLDILILGLLVVLFGSIYLKRATTRLRCWVAAWVLILFHFASLLVTAVPGWKQGLIDSISISTLLLSGLCFLFSAAPVIATPMARALVGGGIGLPALFYINYCIFSETQSWPLYAAGTAAAVCGVVLATMLCRGRSMVWGAIVLAFTAGEIWTVVAIAHHQPEQGIFALLFETFMAFAALYWFDFRRLSAGVMTAILGLVAWASVFPVSLLCHYLIPAAQIPPGLWNVPKYFVAFGMILTLLEDEFLAAARATEHYRLLFAASPHPMWIHDPKTFRILEVNDAAIQHYGYSREEFLARTLGDMRFTEEAAEAEILTTAADSSKPTGPWRHRRKDGTSIQVETAMHSIEFDGRACTFVLVQDVTERQSLHEQLLHQAHHDLLTGLPNRLLLEDRLQQSLAQASRHGRQAAILCVDLDRFKHINDTFGHAIGDQCLQQVVRRISARLRAVDTFARTGGDEFVIVLGELTNRHSALMVARNVLESIRQPIVVEDSSFDIAASIGIAIYPDDGTDAPQLLRASDAAMYRAKQAGGSNYFLVSPQAGSKIDEMSELERYMRQALGEGKFEMYYEPQYSFAGHLSSLEAVLRLNHPQLGMVGAERLLPLAEECGLMVAIGNWALDEVCRQSLAWQNQQLRPVRISLRVSPVQFLHADLAAKVLEAVTTSGLDPRWLEILVTDSTVMRNRTEVVHQMRKLAAVGVHFSVADFGNSYSCLSHLHQLPVSTLKIDCSLVERISDPNGTYTIVQAIIGLAHNLGLKAVAEGVERADQMECLRALGCDFLQGRLLAPPEPASGILKYLAPAGFPAGREAPRARTVSNQGT